MIIGMEGQLDRYLAAVNFAEMELFGLQEELDPEILYLDMLGFKCTKQLEEEE